MAKRAIPVITGKRVRLRLLADADLPMTLAWRNQDHIRKWFLDPNALTPEQHRAWFAQYLPRDDDFMFVIEEHVALNKPIGQVSLYRVDWERGCAEYGRLLIGESAARGLGFAHEATKILLSYADQVGLRHLELEVRPDNGPALVIYRRCGFQTIGERGGLVRMARTAP